MTSTIHLEFQTGGAIPKEELLRLQTILNEDFHWSLTATEFIAGPRNQLLRYMITKHEDISKPMLSLMEIGMKVQIYKIDNQSEAYEVTVTSPGEAINIKTVIPSPHMTARVLKSIKALIDVINGTVQEDPTELMPDDNGY